MRLDHLLSKENPGVPLRRKSLVDNPKHFGTFNKAIQFKIQARTREAPGPIAQLAEHSADNAGVRGAIPLWPTNLLGL